MRKYRYDYWAVYVESDAFDSAERACDWAIDECRENARTWRVPAQWTAKVIDAGYYYAIRVCRKTNR